MSKFVANIDLEALGREMAAVVRDAIKRNNTALTDQVKALDSKVSGMQSKLDKCMSFSGEWQQALDYNPGALVRRGQELFVATRHIKSGAALAARDGSGWERI